MSVYLAYILGILTVLIIFIPFYLLAKVNSNAAEAWELAFCTDLATSGGV